MPASDISQIIKERFGRHRGSDLSHSAQNSLDAIKAAVVQNPLFVEFDVSYQNGNIRTGHPPRKPLDLLEDVLKLFSDTKTYPKIDLKLRHNKDDFIFIDNTVELIHQINIPFTLIAMGNARKKQKKAEKFIQAHIYFVNKIKNDSKIKLSLNHIKLIKAGQKHIDNKTKKHIKHISPKIHCLDLEIHEQNWDETAQLAQEFNILYVFFWLRGWPDVLNPRVDKSTILKAVEIEDQYPVKVYFDINPEYIV